ncbi:MAG: 30S ribosomal protein S4 [Acidobacteria bacterium RIFCSPLOWO2_02_FULL_59_13]|nr:MAG: 30S ribosomal protein S4 [Acidobacteria bacterium RIFCSPLOWO2_02_FULL_59_13]
MARNIGPVCRLCRREGIKLFLKGERCLTDSCAIERRNFPPGQHGQRRRPRVLGYGLQLREKQKVRRMYGILEGQFRGYFEKAAIRKGNKGEILLQFLERRLDNVIYRTGLATSRPQARQNVLHGHFQVNGRKVNIPSYLVKAGDVIEVRPTSRENPCLLAARETTAHQAAPSWIEVDRENLRARVLSQPQRQDISFPIQEQLIVELYSK